MNIKNGGIMTNKKVCNSELNSYKRKLSKERYRPLSVEEEQALGRRILAGDAKAINELVEHNLRYAFLCTSKYNFGIVPFEDLLQEANYSLCVAAGKFDVERGCRFQTYAKNCIHNNLCDYMGIKKDMNGNVWSKIKDEQMRQISLDTCFREDEDGCLLDIVEDTSSEKLEDITTNVLDYAIARKSFRNLSEREQDVIERFFGLRDGKPESLEKIGKRYDVTKEAIRQNKDKGLEKLRSEFTYKSAA